MESTHYSKFDWMYCELMQVVVCTYRHKDVFNINIGLSCEIFSIHFIVLLDKMYIEHFIIRDILLLHLDQCITANVPVRISTTNRIR